MSKALIKITYRQVIDASSTGALEKNIFNASYQEFLLKPQAYNLEGKYNTFTKMKAADGRANSLHYKSGFAVDQYIHTLKNQIVYLQDSLDQNIPFERYRFEVIESDITNKALHKVAINFATGILTLFAIVGEYFLLAIGDKATPLLNEVVETFMLKMQPGMAVTDYREV